MTGGDRPDRPDDPHAYPPGADPVNPPTPPGTVTPPRWRPDTHGLAGTSQRPVARGLRRGCWLLVIIVLLICCVLAAWGTDAVLDLRAITSGA